MFPQGYMGQQGYGVGLAGSVGVDNPGMMNTSMQPGMPTIGLAGMQAGMPQIGLGGMQPNSLGLGIQGMQGLQSIQPVGAGMNVAQQQGYQGAGPAPGMEMSGYGTDMPAMGGMAPQFSMDADPKSLYYKTRMCTKWKEGGRCGFGDTCKYAHGEHELRPLPPGGSIGAVDMGAHKKRMGDALLDGPVHKQMKSQPVPAPRMSRPDLWKTRLCDKYMSGNCPFGDTCTYAHGPHELKAVVPPNNSSQPHHSKQIQRIDSQKPTFHKSADKPYTQANGKPNPAKPASDRNPTPTKASNPQKPLTKPPAKEAPKPVPAAKPFPAAKPAPTAKPAPAAKPATTTPPVTPTPTPQVAADTMKERSVTVQWMDKDTSMVVLEKVVYLVDNRLDMEYVKDLFGCTLVELMDGTCLQPYRRGDLAGYSIHAFDDSVMLIQLTGRKSGVQ